MISVLLVDDHSLIRKGFRLILDAEADIEVVGEAADGTDAVSSARRCARRRAHGRPDARPWTASRRPATSWPPGWPSKVLILTTFDLDDYVYAGLRAGASGFLLKDTQPDDLVAAIRTIAAGDAVLGPGATKRLIRQFATTPQPGSPQPGSPGGADAAGNRGPSPAASKTSSPIWPRAGPTARSRPACTFPRAR